MALGSKQLSLFSLEGCGEACAVVEQLQRRSRRRGLDSEKTVYSSVIALLISNPC
jgi:hypothetical protein